MKEGFKFVLDPDIEKHQELMVALRRYPRRWREREVGQPTAKRPQLQEQPSEPTVLPHQLQVIDKIRNNLATHTEQ